MRCRCLIFFYPIYCLRPSFFCPFYNSRNSDPGSRSSTQQALPPWWGPVFQILIICYEEKAEIVQTNRKLRVTNTAQNGQHEKWNKAAPEMGMHLALLYVMGKEKCYGLLTVLLSRRLLLCICWRSTVSSSSVIYPAEQYNNKTNMLPRGSVRSKSTRGALWCFLPRYLRFLRNIKKERKGCNGITYSRGRLARAARLMRGLGCAVAADKWEVPVLIMTYYYSL